MKYTIETNKEGHILSVRRWKPKHETIKNKRGVPIGTNKTYETPTDLEEISAKVYKELVKRSDLNYIKWIDSKVVEETKEQKSKRQAIVKKSIDKMQKDKLKYDVERLSKYFVLSDAGERLLKDGR